MKDIVGNKIRLIPITESLVDPLFEAFRKIDEEGRIMTGTRDEVTIEKVCAFAKRVQDSDNGFYFAIESIHPKEIIGELALTDINRSNRNANFRFSMYTAAQRNKGFGSEALRLALAFGFETLNLHRIDLTVYENNNRAMHIYLKFGFVEEGKFRDLYFHDEKYHNGILMSMLEEEYFKAKETGFGMQ